MGETEMAKVEPSGRTGIAGAVVEGAVHARESINAGGGEGEGRRGGRTARKLRRFSREEDSQILEASRRARGERRSFLRDLAERFGRPFCSVEKRYYYLMARGKSVVKPGARARGSGSPISNVANSLGPSSGDEELTAEWLTLPERVMNLERRVAGMVDLKGLADRLAETYDSFQREQALLAELAEREREIARLKGEFSRDMERIRQREEELDEIHNTLENTLSEWMELSTIDKIKVLGDFALKIETVVDKFGNVIRRRPVVVNR